jgi:hypothetical protein
VDFGRVLSALTEFLEREGISYAVVGAFGLQAYGLGRATMDVDLVAEAGARQRVLEFLESLGYETLHVSTGYSNHVHPLPAMGRVDFVYVGGDTGRLLFGQCGRTLDLGGRRLPVPRPEHLAAMKVQAMKNDPSRTLQDMADVQFLLRLPGVDEEEIRGYFERAGLLERYGEIKRLA